MSVGEKKQEGDGGEQCRPFRADSRTFNGLRDNHVRRDNQGGVAEDADDRKQLDDFEVAAERVSQVAPGEGEVTACARHLEACKKDGVERKQPGAVSDFYFADDRVDEGGKYGVGAEEGDEQYDAEADEPGGGRLDVHHVVNPVVVDGVVEHSRPERRKEDLPAVVAVQDDKPGNEQNQGGGAERERREGESEQDPGNGTEQ